MCGVESNSVILLDGNYGWLIMLKDELFLNVRHDWGEGGMNITVMWLKANLTLFHDLHDLKWPVEICLWLSVEAAWPYSTRFALKWDQLVKPGLWGQAIAIFPQEGWVGPPPNDSVWYDFLPWKYNLPHRSSSVWPSRFSPFWTLNGFPIKTQNPPCVNPFSSRVNPHFAIHRPLA